MQYLYDYMKDGYDIFCHDPYVKYWEEMDVKPQSDLKSFLQEKFDCIVITTGHRDYVESDLFYQEINDSINNGVVLIDTIGLLDIEKLGNTYKLGKNFFILGVGSILKD